jgi:DNA-binding CsgD family transcriptional regulator
VSNQDFEAAMEKALHALEISRLREYPLGEVQALYTLTGIDIMTSRDADAWEKAVEAEAIARRHGFSKELSEILIAKAKLCSYAEISPETGRNDEGLSYAQEALAIAERAEHVEQEAEACYVIGSLYINKNRWNDPIDNELYELAGKWLDRGQEIADAYDIPNLKRNGIMFRARWFQQGNRDMEAIEYFENVRAGLKETDYMTAAAIDDRLVRLYTRIGNAEKAQKIHDDYVYLTQKYMQQKEDETLQEMETSFEVHEKEKQLERNRYQMVVLILAIVFSVIIITLVAVHFKKEKRRSEDLQRLSNNKEQIIELLSKNLKNHDGSLNDEIAKLAAEATSLSADEIRERCLALAYKAEMAGTDVADYVGDILIKRNKQIADIGLSQRELQIIRLSAEGLKASEIAERIYLSVHTVNTHRQRIYAKMDVKNVSDMLRKATELGII